MRQPHLLIIISVVIIIIGALFYVAFLGGTGESGITAMEGKEIASQKALNWTENATLFHIRKASEMVSDGSFSKWIFTYCDSQNISPSTKYIEIEVCYNNSNAIIDEDVIGLSTPPFSKPISNWTIDSDEAYEIGKDNETIQLFLSNYEPIVDAFSLRIDMDTNKTVWSIHWEDTSSASSFENYNRADIEIDASTGEVLYVEADT